MGFSGEGNPTKHDETRRRPSQLTRLSFICLSKEELENQRSSKILLLHCINQMKLSMRSLSRLTLLHRRQLQRALPRPLRSLLLRKSCLHEEPGTIRDDVFTDFEEGCAQLICDRIYRGEKKKKEVRASAACFPLRLDHFPAVLTDSSTSELSSYDFLLDEIEGLGDEDIGLEAIVLLSEF